MNILRGQAAVQERKSFFPFRLAFLFKLVRLVHQGLSSGHL